MARDGSGTFNLPESPFVYDTAIDEAAMNNTLSEVAGGLTESLSKDGQTVPTANLPMAGFRHTGVGDATQLTQYASAKQAQNNALSWCGVAGGTANAIAISPAIAATAYVSGQSFVFAAASNNTDAVTISVSGLAAKAGQWCGAALVGNEIIADKLYEVTFDGTQFQMSALSGDIFRAVATAGSAGAYTATTGTGITPFDGYSITVEANHDNLGACTLDLDATGAVAIKLNDGTDPYAGAIKSGGKYDFQFDGSVCRLKNPSLKPIAGVSETVDTTNRSTTSTAYISSSVSVSITPKAASSKIKVEVDGRLGGNGVLLASFTLYRDATPLTPSGVNGFDETRCNGSDQLGKMGFSFLDSPGTTSAITYTLYWKTNTGTAYLGRRGDDTTFDVPTIMRAEEVLA